MVAGRVTAGQNIGGAQQIQDRAAARGQDGGQEQDGKSLSGWSRESAGEHTKQLTDSIEQTLRQGSQSNRSLTDPHSASALQSAHVDAVADRSFCAECFGV